MTDLDAAAPNVLLVRLSAMGDLVQSLGAVASLHEAMPAARIAFVTQTPWAPLLDGLPGIARVVCFDRRGGIAALWRLRRELLGTRFDHVLDLQGNWKSALVARLCDAGRRIGMAGGWRQEPLSAWLLDRTIACDASPHPARAAWELVRSIAPQAPFRLPRLVATAGEVQAERAALAAAGVDPARPLRVLVASDPRDPRALRPRQLRALADAHAQPVVVQGPAEAGLPPPFTGARVLRHGVGEVRRLIALGAAVAASGGEVWGPDQGATHVLLASGARGSVLFGSQDPRRSAPPTGRALVGSEALVCRPCRRPRCGFAARPNACMDFAPEEGVEVELGLPIDGASASRHG